VQDLRSPAWQVLQADHSISSSYIMGMKHTVLTTVVVWKLSDFQFRFCILYMI